MVELLAVTMWTF